MGIRMREEIRQCLTINTLPDDLKKERLEQNEAGVANLHLKTDKVRLHG